MLAIISVFNKIFCCFFSNLMGYLEFFKKLSASSMSFLRVLVLNKKIFTYDFDAFLQYMHNNKEDFPYNQVSNKQYSKTLQYDNLPFDTQDIQYFSSISIYFNQILIKYLIGQFISFILKVFFCHYQLSTIEWIYNLSRFINHPLFYFAFEKFH